MTTSIRTRCGDVYLADTISNWYYEAFKDAPDEDACYEAVRDYITSFVDEHLPDNLTWFPSLSEVYVEIGDDPEGYQEQDDDRTVDELIEALVSDAINQADNLLLLDPDAFGRTTPLTEYEELLAAATAQDADQDDIDALGDWFAANGNAYWNGEYYDADGIRLYPIIEWDDETDQGETVGYEIR